jgi:hypothetical protein
LLLGILSCNPAIKKFNLAIMKSNPTITKGKLNHVIKNFYFKSYNKENPALPLEKENSTMSSGIPSFNHAIRKSNHTIRKEKFNLTFKNLHFSTMSSGSINFNSTIKKKRLTLPSGSFRLNYAIMIS